jgi:hypothetical protein
MVDRTVMDDLFERSLELGGPDEKVVRINLELIQERRSAQVKRAGNEAFECYMQLAREVHSGKKIELMGLSVEECRQMNIGRKEKISVELLSEYEGSEELITKLKEEEGGDRALLYRLGVSGGVLLRQGGHLKEIVPRVKRQYKKRERSQQVEEGDKGTFLELEDFDLKEWSDL